MKLRFLDFLKGKKTAQAEKPAMTGTTKPLNEGLQQTLGQKWSSIDIIDLFRLLKFSPNWSPEWMKGSIDFQMDYKYNTPFMIAFQTFYADDPVVNSVRYRPSIRNDRDRLARPVNEAEGGEPAAAFAFRDTYSKFKTPAKKIANKVMAFFGRNPDTRRLNRFVKCDDKANDITVLDPGNEDDLKLLFSAVNHFVKNINVPANTPADVAGDFDQAAFDQAKAAATATAAPKPEAPKADGPATYRCSGYFNDCMLIYMVSTMMGREIQVAQPDSTAKEPPVGKKQSRYDEAEKNYFQQVVLPLTTAIQDVVDELPSKAGTVKFGPPSAQDVDTCIVFKEFYNKRKAELARRMNFQAELDDTVKGLVDVMLNSANI